MRIKFGKPIFLIMQLDRLDRSRNNQEQCRSEFTDAKQLRPLL
jgi:hypothetical protein